MTGYEIKHEEDEKREHVEDDNTPSFYTVHKSAVASLHSLYGDDHKPKEPVISTKWYHRPIDALSFGTISWVVPLIWKGFRTPIRADDIPQRNVNRSASKMLEKAEILWKQELQKRGDKATLWNVLFRLQTWDLTLGVLFSIVQGTLFAVARPLLLRALINSISDPSTTLGDNLVIAVLFALAVFFEGFLQAIVKQLLVTRFGSSFVCWVTSIVQHKATRVSTVATAASDLQESTLIGHDVIRMYEEFRWFSVFPFSVSALIGGSGVLIWTLGVASAAGFVVMLSIIFASMFISKRIKVVEEKDLKVGDRRVSIMKEIISGIKAIKMMAWEIPFQELLAEARDEESLYIKLFRVLQVSSINLGRSSPVLAASVSIFVVAFTANGSLNAADIFAAISAFQSLRLPLISIPNNLSQLANFLNYFSRFDAYMKLDDLVPTDKVGDADKASLRLSSASFQWTPLPPSGAKVSSTKDFRIQNATFEVPRHGGLIAVVGSVASGKSSLLSSCLGGMTCTGGKLEVVKNVAYVPQKAFTLSGTLLDNVLMGSRHDPVRVEAVLRQSALDEDMKLFPRGLLTEIGERGVTLSGGQQQRLAIARALYQEAELLVLDDPLAAVDPGVASTIFRQSVLGFVRTQGGERMPNRSVLMALNQLHLLPEFDSVLVMSDGLLVEQGTYEELMKVPEGHLATMLEGLDVFTSIDDEVLDQQQAQMPEAIDVVVSEAPSSEAGDSGRNSTFDDFSDAAVVALREASSASDMTALHVASVALDRRQSKAYTEAEHEKADLEVRNGETSKAGVDDLIAEDKGQKGAIARNVLGNYFSAVGKGHLPGVSLLAIVAYGLMAANDLWLASWVQRASSGDGETGGIGHIESAGVYFGLSLGHVLFVQAVSMANAQATVRAGKRIHRDCINRILHAPITWFEGTPSGRIISRFSGDLSMIDRQLAMIFDDCFQFVSLMTALCVVICYVIYQLIPVVIVGLIIFVLQLIAVDRTNREVKRYANQALAPVLTNISETVHARTMIQVMGLERYFCSRHWVTIDEYAKQSYCSTSMVHWGTLVSSFLSFFLSTVAAMIVVLQRDSFEPALVGLALTYSFLIPYFLMILSMVLPLGFVALTSLERVLEYQSDQIPQEPSWFVPSVDKPLDDGAPQNEEEHAQHLHAKVNSPTKSTAVTALALDIEPSKERSFWPSNGQVVFDNVTLIYRPGLPPALRSISVTFAGGSKTGIIGRTGAGKSSLTQVLFRVNEPASGQVLIDGQDIHKMGLQLLRSALTIIPQNPLLMGTTVKENLDPFGIHDEEELKQVLGKVNLKEHLLDEDSERSKATSLSAGERQMLSIARVLLKKNLKVVIMDEPTANIDFRTDEFLQNVVRTEFAGSTLLTIAHRLSTVVDFDNILVMDKGEVSQFGPASELMKDSGGIFHQMVTGMGPAAAANLMEKAK